MYKFFEFLIFKKINILKISQNVNIANSFKYLLKLLENSFKDELFDFLNSKIFA